MKSSFELLLNKIPLLFPIISLGPLEQSLEITGALQNIASTITNPGSSHNDDKIKALQLNRKLKIFSLYV